MSGPDQYSMKPTMRLWWWLSVPYTIFFFVLLRFGDRVGLPVAALGHFGLILPFALLAIVASFLSCVWFLIMSYRLAVDPRAQRGPQLYVMLVLSVVAGLWGVIYVLRK